MNEVVLSDSNWMNHQDTKTAKPTHPPELPTDHTENTRSDAPEKPQITQIDANGLPAARLVILAPWW
jgi:hypothetical protein